MSPTGGPTMSPTDSGPDTCTTQGCVQLAAQISSAMNQSVDPCQNFYQFSCGNWGQRNLIPPGELIILFTLPVTLAPQCMHADSPHLSYDIDKASAWYRLCGPEQGYIIYSH